jgi:hypothetical protein
VYWGPWDQSSVGGEIFLGSVTTDDSRLMDLDLAFIVVPYFLDKLGGTKRAIVTNI